LGCLVAQSFLLPVVPLLNESALFQLRDQTHVDELFALIISDVGAGLPGFPLPNNQAVAEVHAVGLQQVTVPVMPSACLEVFL
jgi:hypothetical protein